jgi:Family of unknown function (DUF6264)
VPTDDPAPREAQTAPPLGRQGSHPADIAATILLLFAHVALFGATVVLLSLLVMGTDPCGYVKCGDPAWIDRAMNLAMWAGIGVFLVVLVVAVIRLARHRLAFWVPLLGCVAQVALAIAAAAMESMAGPVS